MSLKKKAVVAAAGVALDGVLRYIDKRPDAKRHQVFYFIPILLMRRGRVLNCA